MRFGDRGPRIIRLQGALVALGIEDPGPVDGIWGKRTEGSVTATCGRLNIARVPRELHDGAFHRLLQLAGMSDIGHEPEVVPGVDVSGWQDDINGAALASAGQRWCYVKLTEGDSPANRDAPQQVASARAGGLLVGAYHFARPDTGRGLGDADEEAAAFLRRFEQLGPFDLPAALDVEAGVRSNDKYNVAWCLRWLSMVHAETGRRPLVYTGAWAIALYLRHASRDELVELAQYPLWLADYQPESAIRPKDRFDPWGDWQIWQWTGSGRVPGIKGKADRNRMRKAFFDRFAAAAQADEECST